jgi:hypothetical protein
MFNITESPHTVDSNTEKRSSGSAHRVLLAPTRRAMHSVGLIRISTW